MFGPMMYRIPSCWVRRSAPETVSLGSFLSSIGTISILYFSPPISTPPLALYMLAVASAQYLLVSPHDAAGPLITPSTPILRSLRPRRPRAATRPSSRPGRFRATWNDGSTRWSSFRHPLLVWDAWSARKAALAESFGVSRTRIRKVLQQLAHEGVVQLERHRGATVARPSVREAREVFDVRRILETGMVRLLSDRVGPRDQALLRREVEAERDAYARQDRKSAITLSGTFHLKLAKLTGNETLLAMMHELVARTSLIIAVHAPARGPICLCDEHDGLIAAIAGGDADEAARGMEHHLDHIARALSLTGEDAAGVDLKTVLARVAARRRLGDDE